MEENSQKARTINYATPHECILAAEKYNELDRQIKVMTAYKNGKSIQYHCLTVDKWEPCETPKWDWENYDYRVTPMTKVVDFPYETIEEILNDMRNHGPFIEFSKTVYNQPKAVIMLDGTPIVECETRAYHSVNAKDLMKYNWQDGKKCCKAKLITIDE